jgi:hypothetical protein
MSLSLRFGGMTSFLTLGLFIRMWGMRWWCINSFHSAVYIYTTKTFADQSSLARFPQRARVISSSITSPDAPAWSPPCLLPLCMISSPNHAISSCNHVQRKQPPFMYKGSRDPWHPSFSSTPPSAEPIFVETNDTNRRRCSQKPPTLAFFFTPNTERPPQPATEGEREEDLILALCTPSSSR